MKPATHSTGRLRRFIKWTAGIVLILILLGLISAFTLLAFPNARRAVLERLGAPNSRPATPEEVAVFPMKESVQDAFNDPARAAVTAFRIGPRDFLDKVPATFMRHPDLESHGFVLMIEDLGTAQQNSENGKQAGLPIHLAIGLGKPTRIPMFEKTVIPQQIGDLIELKGAEAEKFMKEGVSPEQIAKLLGHRIGR